MNDLGPSLSLNTEETHREISPRYLKGMVYPRLKTRAKAQESAVGSCQGISWESQPSGWERNGPGGRKQRRKEGTARRAQSGQ